MSEVEVCNVIINGSANRIIIDATGRDRFGRPIDHHIINHLVRDAVANGANHLLIEGVMGQRYIGSAACHDDLYIGIKGTPGNDLGAFLNGPTIEVFGNAQDMTGNTMSAGRIIVHGNAWDVTGLAARGGRILVRDNSGYRTGIHMKEFGSAQPSIVIGGRTGDYLWEYMAGGTIMVLGLGIADASPVGRHIGAGIHGGRIYVRGKVEAHQLGPGATIEAMDKADQDAAEELLQDFERTFDISVDREIPFTKIAPRSSRPFQGRFDPTSI